MKLIMIMLKKALENGKHVLCEKPAAFTKAEAQSLYQYAMDNRLVLMEAVKTAYCPGFGQLINMVQSGKIEKYVMLKHALQDLPILIQEREQMQHMAEHFLNSEVIHCFQ